MIKLFCIGGILSVLLYPFCMLKAETEFPGKTTLYFFNPESNINNYVSLKIAFDQYLSKFGAYDFQPFNKKELFEKAIKEQENGLFLLSSWHYQILSKQYDLKPALVGVLNGLATEKKILTVNSTISSVAELRGKTIASSGNQQFTRYMLNQFSCLQPELMPELMEIMPVPKDIDALLATSFGMVSAALSNERSLSSLKTINFKLFKNLHSLSESKQFFLPLVVYLESADNDHQDLLDVLTKMGISPEGETRLRMLGLDGWRPLKDAEIKLILDTTESGL